jgi:hypothetical protein
VGIDVLCLAGSLVPALRILVFRAIIQLDLNWPTKISKLPVLGPKANDIHILQVEDQRKVWNAQIDRMILRQEISALSLDVIKLNPTID